MDTQKNNNHNKLFANLQRLGSFLLVVIGTTFAVGLWYQENSQFQQQLVMVSGKLLKASEKIVQVEKSLTELLNKYNNVLAKNELLKEEIEEHKAHLNALEKEIVQMSKQLAVLLYRAGEKKNEN